MDSDASGTTSVLRALTPTPAPPPQAGEGGRFCKPIPACGGSVGRWKRRDWTCKPPPPLAGEGRGGGTPAINARPATAASAPRLPDPCLLAGRLRQLLLPRPAPPGCRLAAGGGPGRAMLLQHALGQHHILGQEPGGLGDGDPRLGAVLVGVGLQQFADRFAQRALGAALELEVAAFAEQ